MKISGAKLQGLRFVLGSQLQALHFPAAKLFGGFYFSQKAYQTDNDFARFHIILAQSIRSLQS
ncbi:MAG: hypothetical protein RR933_08495, partial [Oscillospiraceae bacterium]